MQGYQEMQRGMEAEECVGYVAGSENRVGSQEMPRNHEERGTGKL